MVAQLGGRGNCRCRCTDREAKGPAQAQVSGKTHQPSHHSTKGQERYPQGIHNRNATNRPGSQAPRTSCCRFEREGEGGIRGVRQATRSQGGRRRWNGGRWRRCGDGRRRKQRCRFPWSFRSWSQIESSTRWYGYRSSTSIQHSPFQRKRLSFFILQQATKAALLRKFAVREPNRMARASESDRHIPITRPKWMLSGKRKQGTNSRR